MNSEHKENCSKLESLLEDYLNGDLPRAEAQRVTSHLQACGECRAALDDARISARLVSAAFEPIPDPGPGFARMVMARIDLAERWIKEQRSFWKPFEALAWRLAFSATLALAFLFAYGIRASNQHPVTATSVSAQQQPDIFTVPVSTAPYSNDEVLLTIAEHHHEP